MTDEKLEKLLKQEFQDELVKVPSHLIYETKQKVYIMREKHQKESIKALLYGVVLHILCMAVLLGLSYRFKGNSLVELIGFGSFITSCLLIIGGCMIMPYIQKGNKEANGSWD